MAKSKVPDLVPKTASEALARWDAGGSVFTLEMGGMGPGYEQVIHIVVFELIRAFKDVKLPWDAEPALLNQRFDDEIQRIDREHKLGMSGAQAGAAKSLASGTLKNGWAEIIGKYKDRQIQVSKEWPRAEAVRS